MTAATELDDLRERTDAALVDALGHARRERAELREEIERKIKRYEEYGHAIYSLVQATGGEFLPDETGLMPKPWRALKGRRKQPEKQ